MYKYQTASQYVVHHTIEYKVKTSTKNSGQYIATKMFYLI